jgi:asparagine synthase (glutamine-hydrolysing)
MCGLTGIFSYNSGAQHVNEGELLRMREAMVTRGPDGSGLWISVDRQVGLAHRRLAIIDTSKAGAQPMSTLDGDLCIAYNGEIYNYRELRKELQAKGCRFITQSDTEVLLHLYRQYGREMVRKLRGMYAFALWDEEKRGLFFARDPFGIKPLYYSDDGATVRVASQVKALLAGGAVDTSPDPAGHVGFFLWGYVPDPHTLYRGIRALPAGTSLWIDAGGCGAPHPFFNIRESLILAEERAKAGTTSSIPGQLQETLMDTVQHHLIADVPVGVFLSSGLDSTTLASLVRENGSDGLRTVTLAFNEYRNKAEDEAPIAELVAARLGARHETRRVGREEFETEFVRFLSVMDQPSIDGLNTYFVSKAAADTGLKVAISGLGGDELFGGYPSFNDIPRTVRWTHPFTCVPALGKTFRLVSAPVLKQHTSPKYAGLLEYGGSYGGAYLLRRGLFMPWELPEFLDGELVREGWGELRTLSRLDESSFGISSAYLKIVALEMGWYMRNQLLRDSDWASMAHGLEIRVPFVDIYLLQKLAPLLASPERPGKRELAMVPKNGLPEEVVSRKKTGFSIPVQEWLRENLFAEPGRGNRPWARHIYKNYNSTASGAIYSN